MTTNNTETSTGITGNAPQGINSNAASSATAGRTGLMNGKTKRAINVAAMLFIIVAFILLTLWGVSLAWQVLIAVGLIYSSKLLAKKPEVSWASVVRYLGWFALIVIILSSSFGQKAIDMFNHIETQVSEVDISIPTSVDISRTGTDFIIKNQGDTILDLTDVPEGVVYDFANAVNVTENGRTFTMEEFVSHEYFREEGKLMLRLTPLSGFEDAGKTEIEARAWSRDIEIASAQADAGRAIREAMAGQ